MPLRIDVEGDEVVVRLSGWSRVWALSGGIRIPLAEITSAAVLPRRDVRAPYFRSRGSNVPGVITAGRLWSRKGGREFWFTRRGDRALVIATTGRYRRVVLETEDPDGDAARILAARR